MTKCKDACMSGKECIRGMCSFNTRLNKRVYMLNGMENIKLPAFYYCEIEHP